MADSDQPGPSKEAPPTTPPKRGLTKKMIICIVAAAVIVVGLAVGLGVGLTVGRRRGGDNGGDDGGDGGNGGVRDGDPSAPPGAALGNRTSIWQPAVGTSWQIVLNKAIIVDQVSALTPQVQAYDIDMFNHDAATFAKLRAGGIRIICYFSAGTYEDWRADKDQFKPADLGKDLPEWPGEKWVNTSSPDIRKIMKARIKLASDKGCDAVDPDNVDGYDNENGLGLTEDDAIDYVKFIAAEAASYNMATGLKNAGGIISKVIDQVQFSVNEQCVQLAECDVYAPFIKAKKPVFHIEYPDSAGEQLSTKIVNDNCAHKGAAAGSEGFSTVLKKMELDGWVEFCNAKIFNTTISK